MLLYCVFNPARTHLLKNHCWEESCAWWKALQAVSRAHLYLNTFPFQSPHCLGAECCAARAAGLNSCSSSWAVVQTVHWKLVPFAVFGLLCSEIIAVIIDVLLPSLWLTFKYQWNSILLSYLCSSCLLELSLKFVFKENINSVLI